MSANATPAQVVLPSVDEVCPAEEGGPTARSGFTYQDEVAVGFVIEMLKNPGLTKIHCETHDDILLVWAASEGPLAEFVQVKSGELNKLWSIADLCRRDDGAVGRSIYEVSLARDAYRELSAFRIVTLRPVVGELEFLTFPCGSPGREPTNARVTQAKAEIDTRCPGAKSTKGNGTAFWLERCYWDVRHDKQAIERANQLALLRLAAEEKRNLLPEQVDSVLEDLRVRVRDAGDAKWEPDRVKKILARTQLRAWWEQRADELRSGAGAAAGGKLVEKLRSAGISEEIIELAIDLRRDYAAAIRTSRYMTNGDATLLQGRVKSELLALRAKYIAGQIAADGAGFHVLCLDRIQSINADRPVAMDDQAAFLQGCMYDIADRCLHRFSRPGS